MKIYTIASAGKDYPAEGINKGDEYFYCTPKSLRKTKDQKKRSNSRVELQQWIAKYGKSFQGAMASNMEDWQERFENLESNDDRDELVEEISGFIDEKQSSLDNLPYQLQESHVLNEQIDELDNFRTEVESWEEED